MTREEVLQMAKTTNDPKTIQMILDFSNNELLLTLLDNPNLTKDNRKYIIDLADFVTEDRKEDICEDMLEFESTIFETKNMFDSQKIKELDQINDILVHDDNTLTIEITYNCLVTCNEWLPGDKFSLDPSYQSETTYEYAELEGFEYDYHNKKCTVSDDIKSKILKNINSYLEHYYLLKNPDSQYKPELVKLIKIDRQDFIIPELGD